MNNLSQVRGNILDHGHKCLQENPNAVLFDKSLNVWGYYRRYCLFQGEILGLDFHELLCFIGGNPENINDLGAEISICLGNELEEHIITSATVVSIPPGLTHIPLKVKKISKPFVFLEISTTKEYGQGAQMSDGTFGQPSIADQQAEKRKKSRPKSKS